jgi:hypothetical protein
LLILLFLSICPRTSWSAEPWEEALRGMPLGTGPATLTSTNCVALMLRALNSNHVVKALIFLPGATDEFFMFRRAKAEVTATSPTLLDAVSALTNQTLIRATFRAPFLLLHTDEDPLEPEIRIEHQPALEKIRKARFVPHALYEDRDWDFIQPILHKAINIDVRPWRHSYDSWHFYRHSFAAWNLDGWEAVQAITLAGKSTARIEKKTSLIVPYVRIVFEPDNRIRERPKF